jgi:hypothetical protein
MCSFYWEVRHTFCRTWVVRGLPSGPGQQQCACCSFQGEILTCGRACRQLRPFRSARRFGVGEEELDETRRCESTTVWCCKHEAIVVCMGHRVQLEPRQRAVKNGARKQMGESCQNETNGLPSIVGTSAGRVAAVLMRWRESVCSRSASAGPRVC